MRHRLSCALLAVTVDSVLSVAGAQAPPAAVNADKTGPGQPPSESERLSSDVWVEPEPTTTAHWDLLRLPETVTRLVVSPLIPLVDAAERTRLDRRLEDIFTNQDRTRLLLPVAVAFGRDGLGLGFHYWDKKFLSAIERFQIKSLVKTNEDWEAMVRLGDRIPWLDGRMLSAEVALDTDHNERFYGIGNDTLASDERVVFMRNMRGAIEFEVAGPAAISFDAVMSAGLFRQELGAGTDATAASLTADEVRLLPPGFDETRNYFEVGWDFVYDLRDAEGRTNRGTYVRLELAATRDIEGQGVRQSAAGFRAGVAQFIPLLPRNRVLVLMAGTAATTPWVADEQVPLQSLVTLGRTSYLRGYAKRRFRDLTAWWGSVEYRYPIFDFRDSGAGLSSTLFVDVGRVGGSYSELGDGPIRYAAGFGFRGETAFAFVFRTQVGVSPEGPEITFGINESL